MAGAYTALPAVVVPPVKPPKWDPNWVFPGPLPPGYIPNYQMSLSAEPYYTPGTFTDSVSMYLNDGGYTTSAPAGSVTWTASASNNGQPITLMLSSGSEFVGSVTTAYTDPPGFYGSSPSLGFLVPDGLINHGSIILESSGSPFSDSLSSTVNIEVVARVILAYVDPQFHTFSQDYTPDAWPTWGNQDDRYYLTTEPNGPNPATLGKIFFWMRLGSKPSAPVTVGITSSDTNNGTVDHASMTFTGGNWRTPQKVTITSGTGVLLISDPPFSVPFQINFSLASSADSDYNGLFTAPIQCVNLQVNS